MVKKRLILVAIEQEAMNQYLLTLKQFFRDEIDIIGYYTNGQALPERLEGELVLYTSQELVPTIRSRIPETANILLLRRALPRASLEKLRSCPPDTNAVFFDYSVATAKHLISLILNCGFRNLNFTPLGRDSSPEQLQAALGGENELLVIAGLGDLVTITMAEVVDLGWAVIDANVLLESAILLDCFNARLERRLFRYMHMVPDTTHGILYFLRTTTESESKYQTIMELLEDGILAYGKNGVITHCNSALTTMFHIEKKDVVGANLQNVALPKTIKENLLALRPMEDKWIAGGGARSHFTLTTYEIKFFSEVTDYVAVIRSSDRVQRRSSQVRRHLQAKSFRAKYTFQDILGSSPAISLCRQTAERLARAEGSVLITGETGTGKELFAQAIHNASPRCGMPFVAVNCAALTPSLLESELFGYEAGAFTGSKAEGHVGLFECAHEGTIFLDEIGEFPIELQAKLLRVLEEQEVRPVGSHRTVPIDVRIIAATNQDLYRLVEEKRFRADLYYRLNLFPLRLPPLRERPEDISILAECFLNGKGEHHQMTPGLIHALTSCPWPGNIRELRNCIQYMVSLGSQRLDVHLLPPHMGPNAEVVSAEASPVPTREYLAVSLPEQQMVDVILDELCHGPMSRTALTRSLLERGLQVTEYRVRTLLGHLREQGVVLYGAGRGGIRLTPKGFDAAMEVQRKAILL